MWPFSLFKKKKKYRPSRPFNRAELPPLRESSGGSDLNDPLNPANPLSLFNAAHSAETCAPPAHTPPPVEHHTHHHVDTTPPPTDFGHHDHSSSTNSFDFGGGHSHH